MPPAPPAPIDPMAAHLAVVRVRLEFLKSAIQMRSWDQTEFQFDRVLRSVTKAEALIATPAPPDPFGAVTWESES